MFVLVYHSHRIDILDGKMRGKRENDSPEKKISDLLASICIRNAESFAIKMTR